MRGQTRLVLRAVLHFAVAYVVFAAAIYIFQRRLLYLPDTQKPTEWDLRAVGLRFWPSSDNTYRGLIGALSPDKAKGTVIVFHGNAGTANYRSHYVRPLESLGYRVILAEYPGYGGRSGRHSESSFVSDARKTIELAYEEFGKPVFLWGESLGCGVVASVITDPPVPVAGVILLTPWDTLPRLAQTLYWYLPARWMVRDQYDNIKNLKSFNGHVAMLMAEQDEIVPKRHSLRLYESLLEPKRLWVFHGAGHNSWPVNPTETWWREVMDFVVEQG